MQKRIPVRLAIATLSVIISLTACGNRQSADSAPIEVNYSWMTEFIEPPVGIKSSQVYSFECELVTRKPKTLTTTCADFGEAIFDIKWSTWGIEGAIGEGTYSINNCNPSCAEGTRSEKLVLLQLSDVTFDGNRYYLNTLNFFDITDGSNPVGSVRWDLSEFYRAMSE